MDLVVFNASNNQEYTDDNAIIPRNTQVIVKRTPPHGKQGTAQRYVVAPQTVRSAPQSSSSLPKSTSLINKPFAIAAKSASGVSMGDGDEISNLFKQSDEHWDSQQRSLASHRPVFRPTNLNYRPRGGANGYGGAVRGPGGGAAAGGIVEEPAPYVNYPNPSTFSSRPPPAGYICFRCGKSGHYLNMCPTQGNAEFDGPRLKKTTGIPKMFLKVVEKSEANGNVMVTASGDLVVAQPNDQVFNQIATKTKSYKISDAAVPDELKCSLCDQLFSDAVIVPCCSARQSLLDNPDATMRFRCPHCKADQFPDNLIPGSAMRAKVQAFVLGGGISRSTTPDKKAPVEEEAILDETPLYDSSALHPEESYGTQAFYQHGFQPYGGRPPMMTFQRPPPQMNRGKRSRDEDVIDLSSRKR